MNAAFSEKESGTSRVKCLTLISITLYLTKPVSASILRPDIPFPA